MVTCADRSREPPTTHHERHRDALAGALDGIPHAGQRPGRPVLAPSHVLHRIAMLHLRVIVVAPVFPAADLVVAAEHELHHLQRRQGGGGG